MFPLTYHKWALPYLRKSCLITIFVAAFGILYEQFSHGILSRYMILAFVIPLIFGVIYYVLALVTPLGSMRCIPAEKALNIGAAWLTVGSIVKGILNIYGTTNRLVKYYFLISALLLAGAIGMYFMHILRFHRNSNHVSQNLPL